MRSEGRGWVRSEGWDEPSPYIKWLWNPISLVPLSVYFIDPRARMPPRLRLLCQKCNR
jgi:hypothetical protein